MLAPATCASRRALEAARRRDMVKKTDEDATPITAANHRAGRDHVDAPPTSGRKFLQARPSRPAACEPWRRRSPIRRSQRAASFTGTPPARAWRALRRAARGLHFRPWRAAHRQAAADVGQHNEEIFGELGFRGPKARMRKNADLASDTPEHRAREALHACTESTPAVADSLRRAPHMTARSQCSCAPFSKAAFWSGEASFWCLAFHCSNGSP